MENAEQSELEKLRARREELLRREKELVEQGARLEEQIRLLRDRVKRTAEMDPTPLPKKPQAD